jgi:glycosyltransferase involved in cell wall biosynthesis
MREAALVIFPSEWYENFPLTIAEAFACGTPILASRIGAMAEIVDHQRLGLLFTPGDPVSLREQVLWAQANPDAMATIGATARVEFEERYSAESNYRQLMAVYERAGASIGAAPVPLLATASR